MTRPPIFTGYAQFMTTTHKEVLCNHFPHRRYSVTVQTFDEGQSLPAHLEKHAPERTTAVHTKAGDELIVVRNATLSPESVTSKKPST